MFALNLLALQDVRYTQPGAMFTYALIILVVLGVALWLMALLLGFARAKSFGPAARWFALSATCVFLYHLHLIAFVVILMVMSTSGGDASPALKFGFFFNAFIVLGALCAIMGFVKMKAPVAPVANVETVSEA